MFKRKNIITIVLAVFCFVLSACGNNGVINNGQNTTKKATSAVTYPLKVVDSYNRTITIEKEPKRIIAIAPNITEGIYALGKGTSLVGRSDYDNYPAKANKVTSVGDLLKPNIEKIVELKPDVVIASTHFDKNVIKKLEELNIKVIVLYGEENFTGVYDTMSKLGQIVNASDKALSIISAMQKKVADVTKKVKGAKKPTVYYVAGFGKSGDFTAGKDTFIGNMIDMAGGENAAKDVVGWKYSVEKLVEKNPDVLICSKLYGSKKGIEATNGYKDLKAVKSGKLLEVDENIITRQGPRLADGLEAIAKLIHPELFK
ncbi:ABC transporter substrate-binding protein [Clostridium estertheticum]|uniref:ABC transporter substrate-binding protein n=1 Tax=Clostridium estertheticum TaxID=238834 RepID=UPI00124D3C0D|nr:ABC transporter substrate-binding protein [Clostridium estertheticum]MBU3076128.1 ABC transporter substrate-binding protein [Clostridium estertheticum]MBU3165927.1 ABC transporter substrate-binding protein [Clostridium estertheticum]MBX4258308.1 ABC transporter substrate-binding protein [Clostridium estertheticum]MBZ9616021.1 ABC transporter substrate-binding protein [Clostridium estertheticum subsp. laramiense]WAG75884.1 ABC transporter substrate-binding protein [Clostridium estertheticum]